MPGRDGYGPSGAGRLMRRGSGFCRGKNSNAGFTGSQGFGRGFGSRRGCRRGVWRGFGNRNIADEVSETESGFLKSRVEILEADLDLIRKRIIEMESKS